MVKKKEMKLNIKCVNDLLTDKQKKEKDKKLRELWRNRHRAAFEVKKYFVG